MTAIGFEHVVRMEQHLVRKIVELAVRQRGDPLRQLPVGRDDGLHVLDAPGRDDVAARTKLGDKLAIRDPMPIRS